MVQAIVRCPGKFFDSTPSGILVNKFSNDLGIIDNSMIFGLIDAIEGPIIILVAIVNICQINVFFLIPAFCLSLVAIVFFNYARPVIMGCKQLDLQQRSPIFHNYSETINGLTQVKVYNQRQPRIQTFSAVINRSTKAAIAFDMVSRGFGFY
jgi:ATP-binding cassette, subfamily C (CFTR/MRP), member 4